MKAIFRLFAAAMLALALPLAAAAAYILPPGVQFQGGVLALTAPTGDTARPYEITLPEFAVPASGASLAIYLLIDDTALGSPTDLITLVVEEKNGTAWETRAVADVPADYTPPQPPALAGQIGPIAEVQIQGGQVPRQVRFRLVSTQPVTAFQVAMRAVPLGQ